MANRKMENKPSLNSMEIPKEKDLKWFKAEDFEKTDKPLNVWIFTFR